MRQTVLITGASGGIGGAIARRFMRSGDRVAVHYYRGEARARALIDELRAGGCAAEAFSGDLCEEDEVRALFMAVRAWGGGVDALINNAGRALPQMVLTDCTKDEWDALFALNVRGAFLCAREALIDMVARKHGSIVNVSSVWGVTGGSCEVAYSATKAALIGLTRALAKEVAPSGIRVNCVAPGYIQTGMNAALSPADVEQIRLDTPLGMLGTPGDVAEAVHFLAGEQARFITGQVLCCDGGWQM